MVKFIIALAVVIVFALFKGMAPEIVSTMPNWLKGMVILLALLGGIFLFIRKIVRSRAG